MNNEKSNKVSQKQSDHSYPSAKFLVDACYQDYMRLQENYNKLYDKLNIALAFSGVVLTLVIGTFELNSSRVSISGLKIWEIILLIIHTLSGIGSVILWLYGTICFLFLMKGKQLPVFKSEDVRNSEVYREKEQDAALWLIDKYTICTNELRLIIADKQEKFEKALNAVTIGLILYSVALVLRKVGF